MKRILAVVFLLVGVAATLSAFSQGVDPAWGWDNRDPLNPVPLNRFEDFQAYINEMRADVENITSSAQKQKEKIDLLWQEADNLVSGLRASIETLNQLVEAYNEQGGFLGKKDWEDWIEKEYDKMIDDFDEKLSKKKDKGDDDDPTDLSDYLKKTDAERTYLSKTDAESTYLSKTDAESTYATKETTDEHETRIKALEEKEPGQGGGGCDDNCKTSWSNLGTFLSDLADYSQSGANGCGVLSFGGTLKEWLGELNIAVVGSPVDDVGIQAFDNDLVPIFDPAPKWAGDGLSMYDDSQIEVKITESETGNIAKNEWAGIAVVDGNGHVRKGTVGGEQLTVITGITGELDDGKLKLTLTKKTILAFIDPNVQQPQDEEVVLLNAPEEEVVVYTEYDTSEHEFYDHIKTVRVVESSDTSPRRRDIPTFTATEHE